MAVKCFQNFEDAERERSVLEEIRKYTLDCPGIVQYYGMKKIIIELIKRNIN